MSSQHGSHDIVRAVALAGVAINKETTDVSIYQETAWERRVRKLKESAFLGPIMGGGESLMDAASEV